VIDFTQGEGGINSSSWAVKIKWLKSYMLFTAGIFVRLWTLYIDYDIKVFESGVNEYCSRKIGCTIYWGRSVLKRLIKMITDTGNIRKLAEDLEKQELDVSFILRCAAVCLLWYGMCNKGIFILGSWWHSNIASICSTSGRIFVPKRLVRIHYITSIWGF
jgi:hypothetical protein